MMPHRRSPTSRSLARLDALFSGCVDEYHGTAYSPGFSKDGLDALRKAEDMRPAFRAACSDFSGVSEYIELREFDEEAELDDHDFRGNPYALNEREAEPGERRMQQIRLPSADDPAIDDEKPPAIRPSLPEPEREATRTSSKASSSATQHRRPTSHCVSTCRWSTVSGRSPTR